ncbi:MAG: HAMP domain-containing protein [bacterium]|nr:HAMP domain-containing protein [bacterium]
MESLRSRLIAAFLGVALLAMIPVAVIPYYSFNQVKREERHDILLNETKELQQMKFRYQNSLDQMILQPAADYFHQVTFPNQPDIVELMKTAPNARDNETLAFYGGENGLIYDKIKNSVPKSDYRLLTLPEYRDMLKWMKHRDRMYEENGKVYQWQARSLMSGSHRNDMQVVGALFLRTVLFEKNPDDSGNSPKATKIAPFMQELPFEIVNARPSLFEGHIPQDAMEKLFDFDGDGEFSQVELTKVELPFIENGSPVHVILQSVLNQDGKPTAVFVHFRPVVEIWVMTYRATQISFLVTLCVIILIAVLIARSIAAPLHRLASASHSMAQGDFNVRIEETDTEEQRIMSSAFNRMAERIQRQIQKLNEKTSELESSNRELAQTHRFLQNVLGNISSGVISVDREGVIRLMNPAAVRVFGMNEYDGKRFAEVSPSPRFSELVQKALGGGASIYEREIACRIGGDQEKPLQISALPLMQDGEPTGLVVTFHDLSDIRKLEEQVRRQDRLASLGRMSAGVAHEIRNPLGIIRGSAQLLNKRFGGQPGEEGLSEFIIEEVNRLSRVVNDFLMFARPPEPIIDEVEPSELVEQIYAYAQPQDGETEFHIETEIEPDLPPLAVDAALCKEAFLNLIINAQQAMPKGGAITIRAARRNAESVALEVRDQGSGISPEQIDRIFDPFYTSKDNGTGLGLSLVHQIISSQGGQIEVESVVDQGSIFRVILPTYASYSTLVNADVI